MHARCVLIAVTGPGHSRREPPSLLIETVEDLGSQGIGFRSLTEAIDTTTSGGKLVFHLFAALAEFERGVIRERTAHPGRPGAGTATSGPCVSGAICCTTGRGTGGGSG